MKRVGWLDVAEAGGALGIQFFVVACTLFGRSTGRFLLWFVALYYALFHATARRASRDWLERIHGPGRVTFGMIYRHVLRFAQVALDRLFLIRRQMSHFKIRTHGDEHLQTIRNSRTGTVLLGAHLGSFEAMRAQAELHGVRVNIVGHFGNARMINTALQRLDPKCTARLIEVEPGQIDFIFNIKECIERGEHVAILADRVGIAGDEVQVKFMGDPVRLPGGVYLLAHTLRCPVYLMFTTYSEPNLYDIYCEPFADRIVLPRGARSEAIAGYAQRYADRLSHHARRAPDNWFNFFDFWAAAP